MSEAMAESLISTSGVKWCDSVGDKGLSLKKRHAYFKVQRPPLLGSSSPFTLEAPFSALITLTIIVSARRSSQVMHEPTMCTRDSEVCVI